MAKEPKPGSIVHIEIPTREREKSKKFYGEVFGWRFRDIPDTDVTLFEPPDGPVGAFRAPFDKEENRPVNYILVTSVDEAMERIRKAGGRILQGKRETPGQGWWAVFEDPSGGVNAVWEDSPEALRMFLTPKGEKAARRSHRARRTRKR